VKSKNRIWWIASYPKSGSTWMRMFINSYVTGFPINLVSAWQYVTGDLQPQMYQVTSVQPVTELEDPDPIYYRPAVLMNHLYMSASQDLTLKTHHAKLEVDGIPLIPPKLSKGALYIIRDPRDVVSSFADHMGQSIDETVDALSRNDQIIHKKNCNLYHFLASWSTHVDSWTVHNKDIPTQVVRYEDLLTDPEKYFTLSMKALGLDPSDKARFKFALEQSQFSNLKKLEEDNGFREKGKGEKFFRNGKSGEWRNTLTMEQAKKITDNHSYAMERWNYSV